MVLLESDLTIEFCRDDAPMLRASASAGSSDSALSQRTLLVMIEATREIGGFNREALRGC